MRTPAIPTSTRVWTRVRDIEDCPSISPGCGSHEKGNVRCEGCTRSACAASEAHFHNDKYDIIIIGAGVIGCAISRELSRYNLSILLIDRADDVGQGASKANSGIIHGGYNEVHGSLKSKLALKGNFMFTKLDAELNFGFRRIGSLVLAFHEEDLPLLRHEYENGKKNGVESIRIIDRDEIIKLEPNINQTVIAALWCPNAGIVSPYEYCIALAENAIKNGVKLLLRREVIDIHKDNNEYTVMTSDENFRASFVINCAGLNSDKVAAMVGDNDFFIVPRKGEYLVLDRSQGNSVNHVLFPLPSPKIGKGVLVSPTYYGNLLLGPSSRDPVQDRSSPLEVLEFLVCNGKMLIPSVDAARAITSYTGMRAKSNTGDFIIGESKYSKNFINVAGIDSPGLTSSPAIACLVVDILKSNGLSLQLDSDFVPYRQPIIQPRKFQAGWKASIDNVDPSKNIICRCERVTESEIVDSIRRGIPIYLLDSVKKRTRAGMGSCQGAFCQDRVAKVLERETNISAKTWCSSVGSGSSVLGHRQITSVDRILLSKL